MSNNENRLDKIISEITDIKVTMARNTEALEYHIHRTDLAEARIDLAEKQTSDLDKKMSDELTPIKKHIAFVKGAVWMLGICAGLIYGLHELGVIQKLF